jgi:cysteine desulfurase
MPVTDPIYLDHNATTPMQPAVVEAMLPFLREHFGNPSSAHVYGRRAKRAVDRAREQVAALLDCEPDEVFFTSGGTEANNLAIRVVLEAPPPRRHVVTSTIEHPATARPCVWLERHGILVTRLPVDGTGRVRAGRFQSGRGSSGSRCASPSSTRVRRGSGARASSSPLSQASC